MAVGATVTGALGNDREVVGLGLAWGRPADAELRDQWSGDLFYRVQVLPNLALTPGLQAILHPSANPGESLVFVGGLRGRLTF